MVNKQPEEIDVLKKRYTELNNRKVATQANLESAEKRLAELKSEALEAFGTDDPGELQKKLDDLRTENERKIAEYREHLDTVTEGVAEVESKHREATSGK